MWEKIDDNTDRMNVPDGWIVRSFVSSTSGISVHQVFIKDRIHGWEITPDVTNWTKLREKFFHECTDEIKYVGTVDTGTQTKCEK